jgi:hypothetical protein
LTDDVKTKLENSRQEIAAGNYTTMKAAFFFITSVIAARFTDETKVA